jgi:HEAT repeat protein
MWNSSSIPRRRSFLGALLVLVPLATTRADELAERLAEFRRVFDSPKSEPEDRRASALALEGFDDPRVVEALLTAWKACAREFTRLTEQRQAFESEITGLIRGQEFGERTLPTLTLNAVEDLKARVRELAARELELGELVSALEAGLRSQRKSETRTLLLVHALQEDDLPFSLRLDLARGAADPALAPPIVQALVRSRDPAEMLVALTAAHAVGPAACGGVRRVVGFLAHPDPGVRVLAASTLARLAAPEGLAPLVARLGLESGRTRRRFAIALEQLTGMNLGENEHAWKTWYAKEGARFSAGEVELGAGRSRLAEFDAAEEGGDPRYAPFYGIPLDGLAIVYVIDCSGSMVLSVDDPEHRGDTPVDAGKDSRLAATKEALIEALGKLPPSATFDIVCFNDVVISFAPEMLAARPSEVKRAQAWVAELKASNATNTYAALEAAFRIAERGTLDRYYAPEAETIFLLTDGIPTLNNGEPDSTERIFAALRAWNPLQRIVVHTIGIGRELNAAFLRRVALENGGRCVQF